MEPGRCVRWRLLAPIQASRTRGTGNHYAEQAQLRPSDDADAGGQATGRGEWLTEVRLDGWRCQIIIEDGKVRVFTRRGFDWTDKFKPIADAAAELKVLTSAIIDGELVYPHESGKSNYAALQATVRSMPDALVFMAFDLLHLDGRDIRHEAVEERRRLLQNLIRPGGRIQFSETLTGTPKAIYAAAEKSGLEGIICKGKGTPYHSGSTALWCRIKCFVETNSHSSASNVKRASR